MKFCVEFDNFQMHRLPTRPVFTGLVLVCAHIFHFCWIHFFSNILLELSQIIFSYPYLHFIRITSTVPFHKNCVNFPIVSNQQSEQLKKNQFTLMRRSRKNRILLFWMKNNDDEMYHEFVGFKCQIKKQHNASPDLAINGFICLLLFMSHNRICGHRLTLMVRISTGFWVLKYIPYINNIYTKVLLISPHHNIHVETCSAPQYSSYKYCVLNSITHSNTSEYFAGVLIRAVRPKLIYLSSIRIAYITTIPDFDVMLRMSWLLVRCRPCSILKIKHLIPLHTFSCSITSIANNRLFFNLSTPHFIS